MTRDIIMPKLKDKSKQSHCNISRKQARSERIRLCLEDIHAVQNGKKRKDLESSEKHQMQKQSLIQIGDGTANRQWDVMNGSDYRNLHSIVEKKKNPQN